MCGFWGFNRTSQLCYFSLLLQKKVPVNGSFLQVSREVFIVFGNVVCRNRWLCFRCRGNAKVEKSRWQLLWGCRKIKVMPKGLTNQPKYRSSPILIRFGKGRSEKRRKSILVLIKICCCIQVLHTANHLHGFSFPFQPKGKFSHRWPNLIVYPIPLIIF